MIANGSLAILYKTLLKYRLWLVYLAVLSFAHICLTFSFLPDSPITFPDTQGYVIFRDGNLFRVLERLWNIPVVGIINDMNLRSFTVPFIYSLFNSSHDFMYFQTLLSSLSWLFFSISASIFFLKNNFLRVFLIFTLSLSYFSKNIYGWNGLILSESLSISFLLLLIGILLNVETIARKSHDLRLQSAMTRSFLLISNTRESNLIFRKFLSFATWLLCAILLFLWINTRDSNLFICGLFLPVLLFRIFNHNYSTLTRKRYAVIFFLLVVTCAYLKFDIEKNLRHQFPMTNVISQRILTNQEYASDFFSLGFPNTADYVCIQGKWAHESCDRTPTYRWLNDQGGKAVVYKWFIKNLGDMLSLFFSDLRSLIGLDTLSYYGLVYASNPTLELISRASILDLEISPLSISLLFFLFLAFSFSATELSVHFSRRSLVIFLFFAGFSQLFLSYHGDALETGRHALIGWLLIKIFAVLAALHLIENLMRFFLRSWSGHFVRNLLFGLYENISRLSARTKKKRSDI